MRSIDRHSLPAKVLENPLDHRRFLDAGDDAQPAAASPVDLDVYRKYALEALGPGHHLVPIDGRCLTTLSDSACAGHNLCPVGARRCEHAVITGQVGHVQSLDIIDVLCCFENLRLLDSYKVRWS